MRKDWSSGNLQSSRENRPSVTNYESSEIEEENVEEGDLIQGIQERFSEKRSLQLKSANE